MSVLPQSVASVAAPTDLFTPTVATGGADPSLLGTAVFAVAAVALAATRPYRYQGRHHLRTS